MLQFCLSMLQLVLSMLHCFLCMLHLKLCMLQFTLNLFVHATVDLKLIWVVYAKGTHAYAIGLSPMPKGLCQRPKPWSQSLCHTLGHCFGLRSHWDQLFLNQALVIWPMLCQGLWPRSHTLGPMSLILGHKPRPKALVLGQRPNDPRAPKELDCSCPHVHGPRPMDLVPLDENSSVSRAQGPYVMWIYLKENILIHGPKGPT